MRKKHDQILRNIYKLVNEDTCTDSRVLDELLSSSALPATCYEGKFKNIQHAIDICLNGQNTTFRALYVITRELLDNLRERSYKSHRMPLEFYDFIVERLTRVKIDVYFHNGTHAAIYLSATLVDMQARWGYSTQHKLMEAYRAVHKLPSFWYDNENTDPEYNKAWNDYFEYQKNIRFQAYWKWLRVFENIQSQLEVARDIDKEE